MIIFGLSCKWIDNYGESPSEKAIVHVLPAEPTEEPPQPILLVNDEDINDVTFTGIQHLKPEEEICDEDNDSKPCDDDDDDDKSMRAKANKTKLIISGNSKMRRLIVFTNASSKFCLRRVRNGKKSIAHAKTRNSETISTSSLI